MKLTGKEVMERLEELHQYDIVSVPDFYEYGMDRNNYEVVDAESLDEDSEDEDEQADIVRFRQMVKELGPTEHVHSDHPAKDWNYDTREIWKFVNHDVYVAVTGEYQSFVGMEYGDEFILVEPKKKTVTIFEEV